MSGLLASALFILAIHILVSGTRIRDRLVAVLGEQAYLGMFSLASLAGFIWMAMAYNKASVSSENQVLWIAPTGVTHMGGAVVLIAFLFAVVGITTPNPTSVQQEKLLKTDKASVGMTTITRHPFLWGVILWSSFHLLVNGDMASIGLCGALFLLSVLGTRAIDLKRRRNYGKAWQDFASKTSNIPFAAILTRRTKLDLRGIGLWRVVLALAIYAGVFYGHLWIFGVAPIPGWAPY